MTCRRVRIVALLVTLGLAQPSLASEVAPHLTDARLSVTVRELSEAWNEAIEWSDALQLVFIEAPRTSPDTTISPEQQALVANERDAMLYEVIRPGGAIAAAGRLLLLVDENRRAEAMEPMFEQCLASRLNPGQHKAMASFWTLQPGPDAGSPQRNTVLADLSPDDRLVLESAYAATVRLSELATRFCDDF